MQEWFTPYRLTTEEKRTLPQKAETTIQLIKSFPGFNPPKEMEMSSVLMQNQERWLTLKWFKGSPALCGQYHKIEELQQGLGKRFASKLLLTLNSIKRNPHFASVRYDDIRCTAIKKFPYMVHYHIDEDELLITILAVYSTHKEPLW